MSTERDDGGPAFPSPLPPEPDRWDGDFMAGMSLRDYFAAKANVPRALAETKVRDRMQADGIFSPPTEEQISIELARLRYMAADAMLKARTE